MRTRRARLRSFVRNEQTLSVNTRAALITTSLAGAEVFMIRCKIGATLLRLRPCTKHSAKPSLGLEARATYRLTFYLSLQWRCRQLSGSLMMMAIPFQAVIDIDDSLGFSLRTNQASSWQSMTTMARPHGLRGVAKRASDQGGPHSETNAPSQPASFTAHMTASPGKLQWSNGEQWSRER